MKQRLVLVAIQPQTRGRRLWLGTTATQSRVIVLCQTIWKPIKSRRKACMRLSEHVGKLSSLAFLYIALYYTESQNCSTLIPPVKHGGGRIMIKVTHDFFVASRCCGSRADPRTTKCKAVIHPGSDPRHRQNMHKMWYISSGLNSGPWAVRWQLYLMANSYKLWRIWQSFYSLNYCYV